MYIYNYKSCIIYNMCHTYYNCLFVIPKRDLKAYTAL